MKKFSVAAFLMLMLSSVCLQAQVKHRPVKSSHSGLAASIARGKAVYVQQCLACHQADGNGVPTMNPPLIKTTYILGDKAKLITIVLNGFNEDVEINGQTYSNNMPPHNYMKDQEIADVLTYVRNSFTNKASGVSVAQVKTVRASNKK